MASIAIIGTGDFARGLGQRLITHNYEVTFGSRFPKKRTLADIDPIFGNAHVKSIEECISTADIVFICVHHLYHGSLKVYADALEGKIVIDVGNRDTTPKEDAESSIAEDLAAVLPRSLIVKGFNTLSAYGLANDAGDGKTVYICGDDEKSRATVLQIARSCGFNGVDAGNLKSARKVEMIPHVLCQEWSSALWITLVTAFIWLTFLMIKFYVLRHHPYSWGQLPMDLANKFFGAMALTLLAFCYLPGCIAAIVQLWRGTKYSWFPSWLDKWLKARKYLGLLALLFGSMHCIMSVALANAATFGPFYETRRVIVPVNRTEDTQINIDSRLNWEGELLFSLGVCGLTLMVIVGITSIPAIGNLMSWRQWVFIQSKIGSLCLLVCAAHATAKARAWVHQTWDNILLSVSFLACLIPFIVLLMKLVLFLPCIKSHLKKIRSGWERNVKGIEPVDQVNGIEGEVNGIIHKDNGDHVSRTRNISHSKVDIISENGGPTNNGTTNKAFGDTQF